MNDITQTLAKFSAEISAENTPQNVLERAKTLITDTIGIAVRARHEAASSDSVINTVRRLGLDGGSSRVFGDDRGYTPSGAALINGTLAHSLDFDDTHARGSIHSSAPIVPAALAAGEMVGANGEDVLLGIVAGYEVQIRLSLALVPTDHYDRGFHPTATCGAFGAAAAAGRVLGLNTEQMVNAFGAAGSQASGSMQFLANGAWNKRFHVGHAAQSGLTAAVLAEHGYLGSAQAIEGKAGFLNAYSPNPKPELAVAGLGEIWETMALAVKPYPSCRYTHAALDGLIALKAKNELNPNDIERVEVGLPETGWKIVGVPEAVKQHPTNVVDGQFSMPFCAAVVLRQGSLGWDDYADHLGDDSTLDFCKKVSTIVDPRAEAEFPRNMSAVVRVRSQGQDLESFVAVPKGEPSNFVSDTEIQAKFMGLVSPYLEKDRSQNLLATLGNLERAGNIGEVMELASN